MNRPEGGARSASSPCRRRGVPRGLGVRFSPRQRGDRPAGRARAMGRTAARAAQAGAMQRADSAAMRRWLRGSRGFARRPGRSGRIGHCRTCAAQAAFRARCVGADDAASRRPPVARRVRGGICAFDGQPGLYPRQSDKRRADRHALPAANRSANDTKGR